MTVADVERSIDRVARCGTAGNLEADPEVVDVVDAPARALERQFEAAAVGPAKDQALLERLSCRENPDGGRARWINDQARRQSLLAVDEVCPKKELALARGAGCRFETVIAEGARDELDGAGWVSRG